MCNVEGPPIRKGRPEPMSAAEPLPIYLDHNATTPVCEEAWRAIASCKDIWGNPSSTHPYGQHAKYYVEECRDQIAAALGAPSAASIIFTSGGTESNNLAVIGGCSGLRRLHPERNVIITSPFEHPAIDEVLKYMEKERSFVVIRCPVSADDGVIKLDVFAQLVSDNKEKLAMVTIMHAQNEIGAVQPIADVVKVVRQHCGEHKCLVHTDAAQSIGKVPVNVEELGVDMLSVCSHKFYGPKGVGALFCRNPTILDKIQFGASHEKGMRPGTENTILIMGMATALTKATKELDTFAAHIRHCRDTLYAALVTECAKKKLQVLVNGSLATALPNTLSIALRHVPTGTFVSANRLIHEVQRSVCFSAGSACHSTSPGEPIVVSHALLAVGCDVERAIGTMRLSTGHLSTELDMKRAAKLIAQKAGQQIPEVL